MSFIQKSPFRVLLVNPKVPRSYWGFQETLWFIGARAAHIPLPLITLAALLPRDWQIKLVDLNIEKLRDKQIQWADAVLLTGMIIQNASLNAILKRCQELGVPTIVGGPYASSLPDAKPLQEATSLVIGEVEDEELFRQLIHDLQNKTLKPRYTAALKKPSLHQSPIPRFDLLKRKAYAGMSIQVSRGCPHHCEFCNVRMLFGQRPRYKKPEQVTSELQAIYQTGFRGNVFVVDDNFIGDVRAAKTVLLAMEDWQNQHGHPLLFYTEADIRLSEQEELVDLMVRAGFFAVFLGIESPSEIALLESSKKQNLKCDIQKTVKRLREKGLLVWGGFIVGFDSDKLDIFDRMRKLIEGCSIDFAMVGMLFAIPGTPLEKRLLAEKRLFGSSGGDSFCETNIITKGMNNLELLRGYCRLLRQLYDPKIYFKRSFAALLEWRKGGNRNPTFRELLAVPRSIVRQGILSSYSLYYWNFILKTLFRCPTKIARAFATAISGHHFFRYTRRFAIPQLHEAEKRLLARS